MFGDGALTFREFAMREPLPLATIRGRPSVSDSLVSATATRSGKARSVSPARALPSPRPAGALLWPSPSPPRGSACFVDFDKVPFPMLLGPMPVDEVPVNEMPVNEVITAGDGGASCLPKR